MCFRGTEVHTYFQEILFARKERHYELKCGKVELGRIRRKFQKRKDVFTVILSGATIYYARDICLSVPGYGI